MKKLCVFVVLSAWFLGCSPIKTAKLNEPAKEPASTKEAKPAEEVFVPEAELTAQDIAKNPTIKAFEAQGIKIELGKYDSLISMGPAAAKRMLQLLEQNKADFFALKDHLVSIQFGRKQIFEYVIEQKRLNFSPLSSAKDIADLLAGLKIYLTQIRPEVPGCTMDLVSGTATPQQMRGLAEHLYTLKDSLKLADWSDARFIPSRATTTDMNSKLIQINPSQPVENIQAFLQTLAYRRSLQKFTPGPEPLGTGFNFGPDGDYDQALKKFDILADEFLKFSENNPLQSVSIRSGKDRMIDVEYWPTTKTFYFTTLARIEDIRLGLEVFPVLTTFINMTQKQVEVIDGIKTIWNYERQLRSMTTNFDLLYLKRDSYRNIQLGLGQGPPTMNALGSDIKIPYGSTPQQLKELLETLPESE